MKKKKIRPLLTVDGIPVFTSPKVLNRFLMDNTDIGASAMINIQLDKCILVTSQETLNRLGKAKMAEVVDNYLKNNPEIVNVEDLMNNEKCFHIPEKHSIVVEGLGLQLIAINKKDMLFVICDEPRLIFAGILPISDGQHRHKGIRRNK